MVNLQLNKLERIKEEMQGVNKSICLGVLFLIGLSCSSVKKGLTPTNNSGGYKIVSLKNDLNSNLNEIYIFGSVFDVDTKEPINYANLKIGCYSATANVKGEYSFNLKRFNSAIYVEVFSVLGYKSIQTNPIKTNGLDSLNIDFFLVEEDRHLIDCVEVFEK